MRRLALAVIAVLLAWAAPAAAQAPTAAPPPEPAPPPQVMPGPPQMQPPPPPQAMPAPPADPTAHRHAGVYLHLDLGLGALVSSASTPLGDAKISGAGGNFSVAVGAAISENFIVAGHVWDHVASNPTVTLAGMSASSTNSSLTLVGLGVDLTWYDMPSNFYITMTPAITSLSVDVGGSTSNTENGLGFQLTAGKEWWVSDHWGMGLNLQLAVSSNKDKGTNPPTWGSSSVAVAFSATYN